MKLCYVFPGGEVVGIKAIDDQFWTDWMHKHVERNPHVIFFYTRETTDIWEDEIEVPTNVHAIQFDETNANWARDEIHNTLFLKGVMTHMNNMFQLRGHLLINDVMDALRMPRTSLGCVSGWLADDINSPIGYNICKRPDENVFDIILEDFEDIHNKIEEQSYVADRS